MQDVVKLCKDCVYFRRDPLVFGIFGSHADSIKYGKCTKEPKVDVVDGTTEHELARWVRSAECRGAWFQPVVDPAVQQKTCR